MNILILIILCCLVGLKAEEGVEILSVNVDGLLMNQAVISASATCGLKQPEKFCRLVDEGDATQFSYGPNNVLCDICDSRNQSLSHPIQYAKSDDDNQWWQSPSMAQGLEYEKVNVTIDLQQVYQIVYIILKMGDSPRPGNWILERSMDGIIYEPWIFFAETPFYCYKLFQRQYPNLKMTTNARPRSLGDDEQFCTTFYSQQKGLRSGEIIISLIHSRKSLMGSTESYYRQSSIPTKLINFLSARYIRFRFLKHLTLAADLMTHKGFFEKSIYNRYFYSLRNIEIGGKCICNNHADKCDKMKVNGVTVARCNCRHNTCGRNCEICCPLFNQKQWRPGATCEECNCNRKASSCVYNQTVSTLQLSMNKLGRMDGGGVCIGCRENTAGINCEKCKSGYYRPYEIQATATNPCRRCTCHGPGTNSECISNGEEVGNQRPGDCKCRTGYEGRLCDRCSLGYQTKQIVIENRQVSICMPCPCSVDGSVTSGLYRCFPPCNCRVNVDQSSNCQKCKFGYFNLDKANDEGCQACYCFGITNKCQSLKASTLTIQKLTNWRLSTETSSQDVELNVDPKMSSLGYPTALNKVVDIGLGGPSVYYWRAPTEYLGNWLTSYKTILMYVVKIDVHPKNLKSQIDSPDVILECGNVKLTHWLNSLDKRLQRKILIPIKPAYWTISNTEQLPTMDILMTCLVNINNLLIKAKYYANQNSVSLLNVTLNRGSPQLAMNQMPYIEKCQCPEGYSGISCETCEPGYRRLNNLLVQGRCEKCKCNNYSMECDAFTGHCKNCQNNTAGPFCNECKMGYYSYMTNGLKMECKKCNCPLADYQMTEKCQNFKTNQFLCEQCTQNTAGPYCQRCEEGYYGNPMKKIRCKKCNCNNNEESCNTLTGECKCRFTTMGSNCELCSHGYYGDASKKNCTICNCHQMGGSKNQYCNTKTGQCQCNENFAGLKCDTCQPGFKLTEKLIGQPIKNVALQCKPCQCNSNGVTLIDGSLCHPKTGKCYCKTGINGGTCTECLPNHFDYPNCQKCQCSSHAVTQQCHLNTGLCNCGKDVMDTRCNKCIKNHFWFNRTDCAPCNCGIGSVTPYSCDMDNGQCTCAPFATGRQCDKCLLGYYGVTASGCKECPKCYNGKVCNQDGICKCPRNTEGDYCEKCIPNSWGYSKTKGCQMCNCSSYGSSLQSCDVTTGQCSCNLGFKGLKCDRCLDGFYQFPICLPCQCNVKGTLEDKIDKCHPITGKCECKINVIGLKCDVCKTGSFGLDNYEGGCYNCFCSGRSSDCKLVKDLKLIPITEKIINIQDEMISYIAGKDYTTIEFSSATSLNIGWPLKHYRPMYADLSPFLTGTDLTKFYRSNLLDVIIRCMDSRSCDISNPNDNIEVILESYGGDMEFIYRTQRQSIDLMGSKKIVVEMTEKSEIGSWYLTKFNGKSVANNVIALDGSMNSSVSLNLRRGLFMMGLLNVTRFKLRLYSQNTPINPSKINLKLNLYDVITTPDMIGSPIKTVEECSCDNITQGFHCEKTIPGYYRKIVHHPQINISVIVNIDPLIQIKPCQCNGHSNECNINTGQCYNCSDFTTGVNCQNCAEGYYGDPISGGRCYPCMCPSIANNFAKTCTRNPTTNQFKCNCLTGYTGENCEQCSDQYYGNPKAGSKCQPCNCNKEGSISLSCTSVGKCFCSQSVRGPKCDQCAPHFAVENGKCKDCFKGCTKELFERVAKLNNITDRIKGKVIQISTDNMLRNINETILNYKAKLEDFKKYEEIKKTIQNEILEFINYQKMLNNSAANITLIKFRYLDVLTSLKKIIREINETLLTHPTKLTNSDVLIRNATQTLKDIEELSKSVGDIKNAKDLLKNITEINNLLNDYNLKTKQILQTDFMQQLEYLVNNMDRADKYNKYVEQYFNDFVKIYQIFNEQRKNYQNEYKNIKALYKSVAFFDVLVLKEINDSKIKIYEVKTRIKKTQQLINEANELVKKLNATKNQRRIIIPQEVRDVFSNKTKEAEEIISDLNKEESFFADAKRARDAYSNITRDIKDVIKEIDDTKIQLNLTKGQLDLEKKKKFILEQNAINNIYKSFSQSNERDLKRLQERFKLLKDVPSSQMTELSDILTFLSNGTGNIDSLKILINEAKQKQKLINDTLIKDLMNMMSSIKLPTSNVEGSANMEKLFNDTNKEIDENLINTTKDVTKSIVSLRERIQSLQKRINQRRQIISELAHGAAARSVEPVRMGPNCVRYYKTYFMATTFDFSLEFYLKPEFEKYRSLVLIGYDDSDGMPSSFAVTMESDNSLIFRWENNGDMGELKLSDIKYSKQKYSLFSIRKFQDKWELSTDSSTKNNKTESITKTVTNRIRISPKTHLFLGGYPTSNMRSALKINFKSKMLDKLKSAYGIFKGCMFSFKIGDAVLGLIDIQEVTSECLTIAKSEFMPKESFKLSCAVNIKTITRMQRSKALKQRVKREATENVEFKWVFFGQGYMRMNMTDKSIDQCKDTFKSGIYIKSKLQMQMKNGAYQLIMVFANDVKKFGFVLGAKDGVYQLGMWRDGSLIPSVSLQKPISKLLWNIHKNTVEGSGETFFGKDDICDIDSYMFFGGIPESAKQLRDLLKILKVNYYYFTGGIRFETIPDKDDEYNILSTRYVTRGIFNEAKLFDLPGSSLFVSSELKQSMILNYDYFKNVINSSVEFDIDFLKSPVTKEERIFSLTFQSSQISLKITPTLTFVLTVETENIEIKADNQNWESYNIKISINSKLFVLLINNKPKGVELKNVIGGPLTSIKMYPMQMSYYIYNMIIGDRRVDFNYKGILSNGDKLPQLAYIKLPPVYLQPHYQYSAVSNGSQLGQVSYQNKLSTSYPQDSAWFDGSKHTFGFISDENLKKYYSSNGPIEFDIRSISISLRTEMLMSITFYNKESTLNLISLSGQLTLHHSLNNWCVTIPLSLANEKWQHIRVVGQSNRVGLKLYINGFLFNLSNAPLEFGKLKLVQIGGFSGITNNFICNNKNHSIEYFSGCIDDFQINNHSIPIVKSSIKPNELQQCPRVLQFINNGGQFKQSYAQVKEPRDWIKLFIEPYKPLNPSNDYTFVTSLKIKNTGFEKGILLVVGDETRFCAVVVNDNIIYLNYLNTKTNHFQSDKIDISTEWVEVKLIVFHYPKIISVCKMDIKKDSAKVSLTGKDIFEDVITQHDVFFGQHPSLQKSDKLRLGNTLDNFVGCISDLQFSYNDKVLSCGIKKSKHIIRGICSLDKETYLRRLRKLR